MDEDNVVNLRRPDDRAEDRLTEVLRHGARTLLAQAIEAEVADFLASHAGLVDGGGRPSSPLCSNERLATALDMMLPAGGARGPGCVPVGDR